MFDLVCEINKLEEKYGDEFNWGTDPDCEYYQKELAREAKVAPYKDAKALAKCYSNDDVLFVFDNTIYRIYHLTYSTGEPRYMEFSDGEKVLEYIEKQFIEEYL